MGFCTQCGEELIAEAKFCFNCGKPVNESGKRHTQYDGVIHKCPNCGEILNSFTSNCPSCGYELRDVSATSSVKQLSNKLEEIESKRVYRKPKNLYSVLYGTQQMTEVDEQKINLIRNFAIPNTKEDLLEFIILAESNIYVDLYDTGSNVVMPGDPRKELSNAWEAKFEQAYNKASYMFSNTEDFKIIDNIYKTNKQKIKKAKHKTVVKFVSIFGFLLAWLLILFYLL